MLILDSYDTVCECLMQPRLRKYTCPSFQSCTTAIWLTSSENVQTQGPRPICTYTRSLMYLVVGPRVNRVSSLTRSISAPTRDPTHIGAAEAELGRCLNLGGPLGDSSSTHRSRRRRCLAGRLTVVASLGWGRGWRLSVGFLS
jgi:hypothetical protein